mmetsp:Transcript_1420/g.5380  ORF Transcript_1420/g.5380 Transcript_1420/m.5380 type:complete len:327 (-) Transcript_1420:223-1203(-)
MAKVPKGNHDNFPRSSPELLLLSFIEARYLRKHPSGAMRTDSQHFLLVKLPSSASCAAHSDVSASSRSAETRLEAKINLFWDLVGPTSGASSSSGGSLPRSSPLPPPPGFGLRLLLVTTRGPRASYFSGAPEPPLTSHTSSPEFPRKMEMAAGWLPCSGSRPMAARTAFCARWCHSLSLSRLCLWETPETAMCTLMAKCSPSTKDTREEDVSSSRTTTRAPTFPSASMRTIWAAQLANVVKQPQYPTLRPVRRSPWCCTQLSSGRKLTGMFGLSNHTRWALFSVRNPIRKLPNMLATMIPSTLRTSSSALVEQLPLPPSSPRTPPP